MSAELEQIRAIFREEAKDLIHQLEEGLLKLEGADPEQRPELLREMMRCAHNLKGGASSLEFKNTAAVAHAIESAVQGPQVHAGQAEAFDVLHRSIDALSETLFTEQLPEGGEAIVAQLKALVAGPSAPAPAPARQAASSVASDAPALPPVALAEGAAKPGETASASAEDSLRIPLSRLRELMLQAGEVALRLQGTRQRVSQLREYVKQVGTEVRALAAVPGADAAAIQLGGVHRRMLTAVNRFELETLHDTLLGEALHASIRGFRLRALADVFRMVPRMARDLARTLGKQVNVTVTGSAIEVEKGILDILRDAVVHLVRNSMDHGLEAPEERAAAGKPAAGRVHLGARLQGAWLVVELGDDGRGVDPERVKQKALASGILGQAEAERASPEILQDLIFHAGLSTKEIASEISGRGVGLDAVRSAVEKNGGTIRVVSTVGQGATFVLQLPLLTHRTHVLLVRVGSDALAVPSASVWKVARQSGHANTQVAGQKTVELDGIAIPVLDLGQVLWGEDSSSAARDGSLVVLRSQGRVVAFAVDEFLLDEDVVVRELDAPLKPPSAMSGVAVRGNGDLLCILNPVDLVRVAGVRAPLAAPERVQVSAVQARRILVVDDSFTVRTLEQSILQMAGYEVVLASDGEEALQVLSREQVDLVVSDVNMPRRDGFDLLVAVRRSQRLRQLPFVLVTSRSSDADRQRGLDLGASAYVVKSEFDQETLVQAVTRLTG